MDISNKIINEFDIEWKVVDSIQRRPNGDMRIIFKDSTFIEFFATTDDTVEFSKVDFEY